MQAKRVVALREFARLSTRRFDAGLAGYLDVLVAENELFAAELALGAHAGRPVRADRGRLPGDGRRLGRHRERDRAEAAGDGRREALAAPAEAGPPRQNDPNSVPSTMTATSATIAPTMPTITMSK